MAVFRPNQQEKKREQKYKYKLRYSPGFFDDFAVTAVAGRTPAPGFGGNAFS
jgi:hypothetical protein